MGGRAPRPAATSHRPLVRCVPSIATHAANAAIKAERQLEQAYYRAMAESLGVEDRSERIARRELYRRCSRIGEMVVDVAERVVYAVVKEG